MLGIFIAECIARNLWTGGDLPHITLRRRSRPEAFLMDPKPQSNVSNAIPHPAEADRMSESEKRALELGAQIEHAQGAEREEMAEEAEDLEGRPS